MHVTIRQYTGEGTQELFDALEAREPEVRELISTVPGFVSYAAVRTGDGGTTVTVCEDKEGTDESTRRAAAWVAENLGTKVSAPSIREGDASLQF
jgi:hypothetical protein